MVTAMATPSQMEKRAVMAETVLDVTKQYRAGQVKASQPSISRYFWLLQFSSTFQASRSLTSYYQDMSNFSCVSLTDVSLLNQQLHDCTYYGHTQATVDAGLQIAQG